MPSDTDSHPRTTNTDEMAVEAPLVSTLPSDVAHLPHVYEDKKEVNGSNAKKAKTDGTKKRRVVDSDEDEDVDMEQNGNNEAVIDSRKQQSANKGPAVKAEQESSEDEKPLAKSRASARSTVNGTKKSYAEDDDESQSKSGSDSEDDVPLAKKRAAAKPASTSSRKKAPASESSEDDVPLAKKAPAARKKAAAAAKPASKRKAAVKSEASSTEDEKPLAKKAKKTAAAKPAASARSKKVTEEVKEEKPSKKKTKKEEEEEELYEWWKEQENNADGDGSVKWKTLHHNGVLFPPTYVPLPKHVKMKYDGQPISLSPEAEEVAGFFAALLETDHAKDAKFRENFFRDWKAVLEKQPPTPNVEITDLDKCDFRPIWEYLEGQKELKKSLPAEAKKRLKAEKDEMEKPYVYCTVDGRKEKIGNFRLEPPGLFRGRGEHPKKGTYKHRLVPEDVIINIGEGEKVPEPNMPGQWKEVRHDPTVTWLAHWKENVNGNSKYVFLSAGSTWKGQSDREKFEKARKLEDYVDKIRKDYYAELNSKVMAERQRATAMYLIDRLALRAGNEKGEDEADTVGCCSLRLEHVTLIPPSSIELRFLGKDSIMYEQTVEVDPRVFKNIKIFKREPKTEEDDLFDRLTTTSLNNHLRGYMDGLTAKVFRTYNASWTFQEQLKNTPAKGTVQEKIAAYNRANKEVAILCNHQKTVSKGHATSMEKLGDKLMGMKYQRMKLRHQLFSLDPKMKKKRKDLTEDESDLDDDAIERVESLLQEQAKDKARKKFEKENLKLQSEGEKPRPESELKAKLKEIDAEFKELKKETKKKAAEPKGKVTPEKILENIQKLDDRIEAFKVSMEDRESNKTVALGTSKINYIDPRLTVAWAKKHDVPLEKLFSKTLIAKFPWALAEVEANPDWKF